MRIELSNRAGVFPAAPKETVVEVPPLSGKRSFRQIGFTVGGHHEGELKVASASIEQSDFRPGPATAADCIEYDRIWQVDRAELEHFDQTGRSSQDVKEWPWRAGAPVIDGDGVEDNYNLHAGDRPAVLGDATAWWILSDTGPHSKTGGESIGIEVRMTAFSVGWSGALGHATFYRFDVTLPKGPPLEEAYLGFDVDPEIGFGGDDFVGVDTVSGLSYAYNRDDFDEGISGYGDPPPAAGILILDGAGTSSRRLLSSFVRYTPEGQKLGPPQTDADYYNYLRTRTRNGETILFSEAGRCRPSQFLITISSFMFPGNPPAFWSEMNPCGAGTRTTEGLTDSRFVAAHGPFELQPGATKSIVLAVLWARGEDQFDSVDVLKENAAFVAHATASLLQPLYVPPDDPRVLPGEIPLAAGIYPNPARDEATLRLSIPREMTVGIDLFDVLGRRVFSVDNGPRAAGDHSFTLPTAEWPPGVYLVRIQLDHLSETRRLVVR